MTSSLKYHAFISYRHADNKQQGRQWASWLHQAIETYEVPSDLAGKKNGLGEVIPSRIYPIFRDEEELPAHADLGKSIVTALDSTRLLIVLCSPNAVASTYVADEIDYFKKNGHSDRIIAAMIAGEPNASWDKAKLAGDFTVEDECFPVPLQFEYDENGERTAKPAEPIAADFRLNNNGMPEEGWTTPAAYRQHLKDSTDLNNADITDKVDKYQQQLHLMLLKIIAGILGVPLGELTQRDKEYQLEQERIKAKKLRRWLSAVAMLAVFAIGAGAFAFVQQQLASAERDNALNTQSHFLVDMAKQENDKGNHDAAMLLSLNAMPGVYGGERPALPISYELRRAVANNQKLAILKHDKKVKSASFSPDGEQLVTTSADKTAVIWSVKSKKKLHSLLHERSVEDAVFSPDGKVLATRTYSSVVTFWSTQTGAKLHALEQIYDLRHMKFSHNGDVFVTDAFREVVLWSVKTGEKLHTLNAQGYASTIFSLSNNTLLTIARNKTAIIWSASNGERLHTLKDKSSFSDATFSPDGKVVVTANWKSLQFWSVESGELLSSIKHREVIKQVTFSPNGKRLVTVSDENIATLWKVDNGQVLPEAKSANAERAVILYVLNHNDIVEHALFSPDGKTLLTSSKDMKVAIWLVADGKKISTLNQQSRINKIAYSPDSRLVVTSLDAEVAVIWSIENDKKLLWHARPATHVAFSADSNKVVTVARPVHGKEQKIAIWSVSTGKKTQTLNALVPFRYANFHPEGKTVLTIQYRSNNVDLWSVNSGEKLKVFKHNDLVSQAKFSPDGKMLLVSSEDKVVTLWSMLNAKKLHEFKHDSKIEHIAFSPSGKLLVTASVDDTAVIWSVKSGERIHILKHEKDVEFATFSHDNKFLATLSENRLSAFVWSVSSGKLVYSLAHAAEVKSIDFDPRGEVLVTASEDRTAVIWSMQDGKRLRTLLHGDEVVYAKFSPDGKSLMTRESFDTNKLILWATRSGEKLREFDRVKYSEFSPDGNTLAVVTAVNKFVQAANDYTVMLWPLYKNNVSSIAVNKLQTISRTCFTFNERKEYFMQALSDEQWVERGCSQFVTANRATQELPVAIFQNNMVYVEKLISDGADVNAVMHQFDGPPLAAAIFIGQLDMVEAFLQAGADPYFNFENGDTLIHLALGKDYEGTDKAAEQIVRLLLEEGVDINRKSESDLTPLLLAIKGNREKVFDLLLEKNADVNITDNSGMSPLMLAINKSRFKMIDALLLEGANVNHIDDDDISVLLYAIHFEQVEVVSKLLKSGANPLRKVNNKRIMEIHDKTVIEIAKGNNEKNSTDELKTILGLLRDAVDGKKKDK